MVWMVEYIVAKTKQSKGSSIVSKKCAEASGLSTRYVQTGRFLPAKVAPSYISSVCSHAFQTSRVGRERHRESVRQQALPRVTRRTTELLASCEQTQAMESKLPAEHQWRSHGLVLSFASETLNHFPHNIVDQHPADFLRHINTLLRTN